MSTIIYLTNKNTPTYASTHECEESNVFTILKELSDHIHKTHTPS